MSIWMFLVLLVAVSLLATLKFEIKTTSFEAGKMSEDDISELYKKHPVLAWRLHVQKSMVLISDDVNECLKIWQKGSRDLLFGADQIYLLRSTKKIGKTIKKISRAIFKEPSLKIWLGIKFFRDPNKFTNFQLGKDIKELKEIIRVLKKGKEELLSREKITMSELVDLLSSRELDDDMLEFIAGTNVFPVFAPNIEMFSSRFELSNLIG